MTTTIDWYPNSDEERHERWVVEDATRPGYFAPDDPPPRFEEPGGTARCWRSAGRTGQNLWLGMQSSAGVTAPAEGSEVMHGARSFCSI